MTDTMNIAEFVGRLLEQAGRLRGFADVAAEASDEQRAAAFFHIARELEALEIRVSLTRAWLAQQGGDA